MYDFEKNKAKIIIVWISRKSPIGLELKLKKLRQTTSPFKTFINKEVPMSENLVEY